MIGHHFHLDEAISIGIADFLNGLFHSIFYLIPYYLVAVFWTEHNMVVDIVDTVVCFSIHD